ncbi:ScbR family autoregulator-binding transcription factor [Streptacidiphilus jiangxiensis]|uniref:DNA-binding transcriptional regulator, AcrR family n=1 Tax=Streptacidiphilus jiangxiensis TaxID=235985 RepID=A0A1H7KGR1_STRJI|nr:DNA-binding transcriptional regulator, AcrR family [Streptacidiphilus jiangxiensis]
MAQQERAVATRRKIIEAAAAVFERDGYQAATIAEVLSVAQVTKGALYFHFASKEELANAVLEAQSDESAVLPQPIRLQEFIDTAQVLAQRLRTEPLVRASVRLTLDERTPIAARSQPFHDWNDSILRVLEAAREQGELLPQVDVPRTAGLCVGAFAGLQMMSGLLTGYQDLPEYIAGMQQLLLPSIAVPSILVRLDMAPDRGERLVRAHQEAERATAEVEAQSESGGSGSGKTPTTAGTTAARAGRGRGKAPRADAPRERSRG